jgi:hypothetical protein
MQMVADMIGNIQEHQFLFSHVMNELEMTAKAENVSSENVQKQEKSYSRHIYLRNKNRSYLYLDKKESFC